MNIKIADSSKADIDENLKDLKKQFEGFDSKAILFFASSIFNPDDISGKFKTFFPGSQIFGCSSSGEIVSGKVLKNSIVAMAFDSHAIKNIKIEILENIKNNADIKSIFNDFEKHFKVPVKDMDYQKYFGIILVDGLSGSEEKIMEQLGNLTNVMFVGGSAGDDLKFKKTYVYANGKSYTDAALFALIEPGIKFDFIKTQSFCEMDKKLIATKVNEEKREVIEFNDKSAKTAYAEALGIDEKDLSGYFMTNPVGLMVNDEPFVRSPQQISGGSIIFYCNVIKDSEMTLLRSTDMIKDTEQSIKNKIKEKGNISAIINFHCILRTLELEKSGKTREYGDVFKNIPTIGFSTYGEQFIGHMNQTSTMLVFIE
jgi:hypothetical protein